MVAEVAFCLSIVGKRIAATDHDTVKFGSFKLTWQESKNASTCIMFINPVSKVSGAHMGLRLGHLCPICPVINPGGTQMGWPTQNPPKSTHMGPMWDRDGLIRPNLKFTSIKFGWYIHMLSTFF